MAARSDRSSLNPFVALATLIGLGFVFFLALGVVIGLVTGDVAASVGRTVAVGMTLTAIVGVFVVMRAERSGRADQT